MSYVVLARKWRPMRFEDLVGQDHVARTLGNAIASGRVAHAFLFTGVRGVGKTTSARILAKALNCMGNPETTQPGVDPGPTATPCLVCPACVEITQGTDVDVREIDGASYNGVDEVRKLQDSLPYRPARDRYKIIIVDEVHMLSQNAWNAFLKTLEEPPPHVKFVFATTEVHKVPITILSRVQRFDFKLIPTQVIAARLRYVLEQEKIEADDGAISIIAREAAGSMRDAMSVLDQVIAWGGNKLVGEDVARVLGVASRQVLHDIAKALVGGDAARCLRAIADLANQGYDIAHVARDLLALLRDLVVAKVVKEPGDLLDLADEEAKDVLGLAQGADADDLMRLYHGFSQGFDAVVKSGQPRAALEMLLVRLARRPPLLPIDDLLGRLSALERRLGGGGRAEARPAAAGPRASAEPSPIEAARESGPVASRESTASRESAASRESRESTASRESAAREVGAVAVRESNAPASSAVATAARPIVAAAPAVRAVPPAPARTLEVVESRAAEPTPVALESYAALLDLVHEQRPELAAYLKHAVPLGLQNGELVIGWEPKSPFAEQASDKESLALLARLATEHFRAPTRVRFEFDSARAAKERTLAMVENEAREARVRTALSEARHHQRVTDAMEILGARLKDLKLASS